ncbi:hypothetical protein JYB88_03340 [Shewanella cyperi]|uniref:Uncharacterized protein n=2 Tax=Shewanella TaxID=22 RepID=A0A975AMS3_9GAMM|nr:hypothetical protein JYB88_03340 [Shewanella cyperi]QSX38974.1 hypothetical protein JYB85_03520 [Shewanella sedimentimangrovi]QSX42529.1 hypothetical protein JYB84_03360 [Shewanella cyperi]
MSVLLLALLSQPLSATEDEPVTDLPPAPTEDVVQIKAVCQQIALEDQVEAADMQKFLLGCLNEQLNEMGYQPLTSLD